MAGNLETPLAGDQVPYSFRYYAFNAPDEYADLVIFYPHVGGQFNPCPGAVSEYVFTKGMEAGADAVLASHSHMLQKAVLRHGIPCAYSMGNFNMDPLSSLMIPKYLPHYGIAMHLYVEDKKIIKTTFSILKMTRKKGGQTNTWPIDALYETLDEKGKAALVEDVKKVYKMVNEKEIEGDVIRREYLLDNVLDID